MNHLQSARPCGQDTGETVTPALKWLPSGKGEKNYCFRDVLFYTDPTLKNKNSAAPGWLQPYIGLGIEPT